MKENDAVWSRWEEVDRLFDRVLDHPEGERLEFLERACHEDDDLRRAVLDLLELSRSEETRGSAPGPDLLQEVCGPGEGQDPSTRPGDRFGRYTIRGVLGRGGMATVYEAERSDGAYDQVVALKLLRRGLDTDRIVERFLAERQILSDFTHPNIARLLDGGASPDGRPFLVVEKVDGKPLTVWADENGLGVPARLRLFLQVTDAVREAHRRLVVHRDLKPSNILVDREGRAKLLDFGIAKLLSPEGAEPDLTLDGQYPLTRRYASPEQARGEPVTVSSDVYQLGLILYELLTGLWPFGEEAGEIDLAARGAPPSPSRAIAAASTETAESVAGARGATPGGLRRRLAGDLDTIAGKALEPDPLDRYRSTDDLARDVRLHLEGRPIQARPASTSLRLRKWVGRNPWAAPVAGGLALAIAAYVGTVTLSAQRLERERNEARTQAERAERIKGFLVDLFRSADPFEGTPGAAPDVTVAEALAAAGQRIRSELGDDPAMQADLFAAVASILENLDRTDEARPFIDEALAIRRRLGQERTPVYAADLGILAQIVDYEQPDSAATVLDRAVRTLEASVPPGDPRLADALAELFWTRSARLNESDPALGERALSIYEAAGPEYDAPAAGVLGTLAATYVAQGRLDEAERAAREALHRQRRALGDEHPLAALARTRLAGVLDNRQRHDEAIPLYLESVRILERTAGPDHNQTLATRNNLATTYQMAGRPGEAVAMHREILAIHRRRSGTDLDVQVAGSLQNLAAALKETGALREADSLASRSYEIYAETTPEGHHLRAFPLLTRTEILLRMGDPARAQQTAAGALDILEAALPEGHFAIGVARCRLGAALTGQGRPDEAVSNVRSGVEILRADERTPPAYQEECERVAESLGIGASG